MSTIADLEQIMKDTLADQQRLASQMVDEPRKPAQPRKRAVLEAMLAKGMTMVQVDCTLPGVRVPDTFVGISNLNLNFSYKFAAGDLLLTDEELSQTLSFSGRNHQVTIPLRAIQAARCLVTGEPAEFSVFTGEDYQEPDDEPKGTA